MSGGVAHRSLSDAGAKVKVKPSAFVKLVTAARPAEATCHMKFMKVIKAINESNGHTSVDLCTRFPLLSDPSVQAADYSVLAAPLV